MALYDLAALLEISPALLAVVLIWSIVWKGIALWVSARKTHKIWFVVLLIFNTIGILEILYIFIFSKMNVKKPAAKTKIEKPAEKKKK